MPTFYFTVPPRPRQRVIIKANSVRYGVVQDRRYHARSQARQVDHSTYTAAVQPSFRGDLFGHAILPDFSMERHR